VSDLDPAAVLDALDAVYGKVTDAVNGLGDADMMRPSRCAGWAVADVLYHQLLDARRALRTFATPSAGPADRDDVSYWRDHVLSLADFTATLAVEAAVHYLDLTVALPTTPGPDPASLALVRRVLAGLLGARLPAFWDDVTAALKGTGREPLTDQDRQALGPLAARFPLFV
jgi:hypothetical protein